MDDVRYDPEKVVAHLEKHRTVEGCPYCGAVVPREVKPPVHLGPTGLRGFPFDPSVAVPAVCPRCGFVQLFWGVTLGVIDRVEK